MRFKELALSVQKVIAPLGYEITFEPTALVPPYIYIDIYPDDDEQKFENGLGAQKCEIAVCSYGNNQTSALESKSEAVEMALKVRRALLESDLDLSLLPGMRFSLWMDQAFNIVPSDMPAVIVAATAKYEL